MDSLRRGDLGDAPSREKSAFRRAAVLLAHDRRPARRTAAIGALGVKKARAEIAGTEDTDDARTVTRTFAADDGIRWPRAVATITDDRAVLLPCCDYPAGHGIRLRTTNPLASTVATVRRRHQVANDPGSRAAGIAMAFTLRARPRAFNVPARSHQPGSARRSRTAPRRTTRRIRGEAQAAWHADPGG